MIAIGGMLRACRIMEIRLDAQVDLPFIGIRLLTIRNAVPAEAQCNAPIYYSKKDAYAMPSNAQLTADFGHAFSDDHKVRAAVGAKYFF
ncbi:hypothetical protein E4P47_01570, partial [Porphyromonas levii]